MYDSNTLAALASGQLVIRDFLTIFGEDSEGDPVEYCFWTGEDDVTVNVVSPQDGSTDSRDFIGGALPQDGIPNIVDSIGLEARRIEFRLSQIHADVQDMIRAGNIRLAVVELHRGLLSPATWALVSTPYARFLGRVDGAAIETPEVGGTGAAIIPAISDVIDLTKTWPALKSDETQRLRSGDRFRRYSDTAAAVEVWWGQHKSAA
jgi:hypothetical protein